MSTDTRQWYVKHRPYRIEDYHSNSITNKIKRRFTSEDKRPNVIMVHGTRGCGKTTIARILSKYYLCTNPKEDGTPCEECEMCQTINERLIYGEAGVECDGVTEVDATKVNGKDAIESLIEDAIIPPIFGSRKIIIFDECHKLSSAAQSSLLKVLEDIPKHLVVIFATTDEDKVLQAIKSRCLVNFEVRKQSVEEMVLILMDIAKKEDLTVSKEALELISRSRDRVPRECINTLEDVAKSYDGEVTVANVNEVCNIVSSELYINFYESANNSLEDILLFIRKLKEIDISPSDFVSGLMKFTMEAMYIKHGIALDEFTKDYIKQISRLFKLYTSCEFDTLLQILEHASKYISEDGNKNDVLLTTTAMRIGKIEMLAQGLSLEVVHAVDENNLSLARHIERLNSKVINIEEDFNVEIEPEKVIDEYEDAAEVSGVADLLRQAAIEYAEKSEHGIDSSEESGGDTSNDEVEEFFGIV